MQLTFANIPFRLPDRATIEHAERFGLLDFYDVDTDPDVGRSALSLCVPTPQRYKPKLGEFWNPGGGMSRYAIFQGLATGVDAQKMVAAVQGLNFGAGQFVMQNDGLGGTQGISQYLYLLPPRPLAFVDNDAAGGLWLITLVDDRWRNRFMNVPYSVSSFVVTCSASTSTQVWSANSGGSLLNWFTENLYIQTANLPSSSSVAVYGQPEPDSALYGIGERACTLIDAICNNIGGFIAPVFPYTNGDPYAFTSWHQALANTAAARLASKQRVAGYQVFNPTQSTPDPARPLLLPSSFIVTFPKWITNVGYFQPENYRDFYKRSNSYADVFELDISTTSLGAPYSANCFEANYGAYCFLATTAKALYASYASATDSAGNNPTNFSAVLALATQLCKDYCDRELASLDEIYQGIQPWPSNTGHDALYVWNTDVCFTRVRRALFATAPREFQHGFGPLNPAIPLQTFAGSVSINGSATPPANTQATITFSGTMPTTSYEVVVTQDGTPQAIAYGISGKTTSGFTLNLASAPTGVVT